MLALSGERESQTSLSNDLGAGAVALEDSTDLSADTPTLEADRSSSIDCGADTPISEVSVECGAECCKDGNTGKPFQARNQSIILKTRKHQGSKLRQFSTDWYKTYPWLVLCITAF